MQPIFPESPRSPSAPAITKINYERGLELGLKLCFDPRVWEHRVPGRLCHVLGLGPVVLLCASSPD